ncbi:MAG: chloride channel protein [Acidimicrobiia bacterium]
MSDVPGTGDVNEPMSGRAVLQMVGYAVALGLVGVISGLVFLGVTGLGADWYGEAALGWFEGPIWWVVVAAGAGAVVGILRRSLRMPAEIPGLIEDLQREHIELRWVPSIVAVSAVSLFGGASLGPEVALGQMGGGAGGWIARRRRLDDDDTKSLTLSGMAGAFGGLFSSPLLALILVLEIALPKRRRYLRTFYGGLIASSVSFGIYFAIVGSVFLGIYQVPTYDFEDWHLFAGVGLGLAAAVVSMLTVVVGRAAAKAFEHLRVPMVVKPVIAGVVFGLIGFALPLTNFTGSDQLEVVLQNASTIGVGLLIAILVGKVIAFSVSAAGGFIGGPIFPILFLGGTAGIILNQVFPSLPLGLAFACMLAAVPGSIVSAPFSMVLLAALLTQIGVLQTAPVLIAVGTAFLSVTVVRYALEKRQSAGETVSPV